MEHFISELMSNVDNCKTENFKDFSQLQFLYNGQNYLLQYSKDKIDWLIKSENDSFNYSVEAVWSNDMVYVGKKDNSILPDNFNNYNVSVFDFLGQLMSFKS
jgi:hypothetical protein